MKRFYEDDDGPQLATEMLERIGIILAALDEAMDFEDMKRPNFNLHELKKRYGR